MSIPTYRTGFPQDGASLGSTKTQIRNNLDGTFLTLGVDHINNNGAPGTAPPGYHNIIHFNDQGSLNPAPVAGVTEEYTKTDTNGTQQIWLETGLGNAYQQTRMVDGNFAAFGANMIGYTYLPGNFLFLYGATAQSNGNAVINFTALGLPNFTANFYIPMVTPSQTGGGPGSTFGFFVDFNTVATTGFTIVNASGHKYGFYWYAIGR